MRVASNHLLRSWTSAIVLSLGSAVGVASPAFAVETGAQAEAQKPAYLKDVGIDQKLGAQVPLDLTFRDENGQPVKLAQFFDGHRSRSS